MPGSFVFSVLVLSASDIVRDIVKGIYISIFPIQSKHRESQFLNVIFLHRLWHKGWGFQKRFASRDSNTGKNWPQVSQEKFRPGKESMRRQGDGSKRSEAHTDQLEQNRLCFQCKLTSLENSQQSLPWLKHKVEQMPIPYRDLCDTSCSWPRQSFTPC